jgi:L,D-transpeptidase YcbB
MCEPNHILRVALGALAVGLLVVLLPVGAQPLPDLQPPVSVHPFVAAIETRLQEHDAGSAREIATLVYQYNAHSLQWTDPLGTTAALAFLERMAHAEEDGLCGRPEETALLRRDLTARDPLRLYDPDSAATLDALDLDVRLTLAISAYAWELHAGRRALDAAHESRTAHVARTLALARDADAAAWALARLEPAHPEYPALRGALHHYRALASAGGWEPVPTDVLLKLPEDGEDGTAVSSRQTEALLAVFERLRRTGEIPELALLPDPPRYDEMMHEGVRRFQERHGLQVDGIVGPETIGALNVTAGERVQLIEVNLDRWRRVPPQEGRHVRVNIPEFTLRAMRGHHVDLEMRVVVGTEVTQTPVFGDEISFLEFSPDWNVPDRIAREDLVPRIARDPGYLERMDFEVVDGWDEPARIVDPSSIDWAAVQANFPYRLRQRPGSENAMGLVKFMFPNEHVVYLHDTPAVGRFEARQRTFSNGCVRVEAPEELAEWLLNDLSRWDSDNIRRAMNDGQQEVVTLDEPVPVELRYFTAWVGPNGAVHFRPDIYGRDRAALERHDCPREPSES